jgi:TonB family protein
MCADELEGLGLLNHPEDIEAIAEKLNTSIDENLAQRKNRFRLTSAAGIAASVAIIIGVSGIIYFTSTLKQPSTELSETIKVEENRQPVTAAIHEDLVVEKKIDETEFKQKADPKPATEENTIEIVEFDEKILYETDINTFQDTIGNAISTKEQPAAAGLSAVSREKVTLAAPKPMMAGETAMAKKSGNNETQKAGTESLTYNAIRMAAEEEMVEEEVFIIVENMPLFIYNDKVMNFREYINNNIQYPDEAVEKGIEGKVIVEFVVETDGSVSTVTVLKGAHPILDKEAKRIIESSPKWKPGTQRGKPTRVRFSFPVVFKLEK